MYLCIEYQFFCMYTLTEIIWPHCYLLIITIVHDVQTHTLVYLSTVIQAFIVSRSVKQMAKISTFITFLKILAIAFIVAVGVAGVIQKGKVFNFCDGAYSVIILMQDIFPMIFKNPFRVLTLKLHQMWEVLFLRSTLFSGPMKDG